MNQLLTLSGTRLAQMIKQGEVSSQEVVEVHIQQIKKVNPVLNAVVKDRFDQAREEAKKADEAVKSQPKEQLPPFLGVPCTIKECFALAVARLRQAGAIPLGVTNVPELCMWFETYNAVYGRTNNAYDPGRIVGGSSGGEGAIISAGGSPFGIGSDLGGSIRMPAFFNGIFGHKPSGGLVPNTGQFPIAENEALRYLTTGPLARKAMPILKIIAGPDGKDSGCQEIPLGDPAQVKIEELEVVIIENRISRVQSELLQSLDRARLHLLEKGAKEKRVRVERLKYAFNIWSSMLSVASETSFATLLGADKPINPWLELLKWVFRASNHTLPSIIFAMVEALPKLTPGLTRRAVQAGKLLKQEMQEILGEKGVLLFPPHPRTALRHYGTLLHPFSFIYTGIFNVLELPVTEVPMGLSRKGLPLGVQVVANHGNDHLTIAVRDRIEFFSLKFIFLLADYLDIFPLILFHNFGKQALNHIPKRLLSGNSIRVGDGENTTGICWLEFCFSSIEKYPLIKLGKSGKSFLRISF